MVIEKHITITHDLGTAVDWLADHCALSRGRIKKVMQCGAVWLTRAGTSEANTQRLRRAKSVLKAGDELHLYYNPSIIDAPVPTAQLIADEGDYSVWFKPAGMYTQGTKWGDHHTIVRWAEQHLQPERSAKIVHRLDRATTGLVLLAHSKKAAGLLSQMFQQRQVTKHYQAVVYGCFGPVGSSRSITDDIDGKAARSDVTVIAANDHQSLLNVHIHTGRKHQVRRHLAENGYPIVGDSLHHTDAPESSLQLQSSVLAFACPLGAGPRDYRAPADLQLR